MKRLLAVGLTGLIVSTFGVASAEPAQACGGGWTFFGTNPNNSDLFWASAGCDGVWVNATDEPGGDYVRGWYDKDGWTLSSLGWQWVNEFGLGSHPWKKIIGNTTTGRTLRGEAYTSGQWVYTQN